MELPRTLVLTGHFPPEPGGVQTFVREVLDRLPADRLVVVAPAWPGDREHDAAQPFPVVRRRGYLLHRGLRQLVRRYGCTAAWVPAAAPFALFVPALRRAGITRVVASTHGQELGWLRVGPTRAALGRMAGRVDVLTCLTPTTRDLIAPVAPDPGRLALLPGGVDTDVFRPGGGRPDVGERLGLPGAPAVVSVGRLVRRKGHDRLLEAWPDVLAAVPTARLTVIGTGPERARLERAAADPRLRGSATVLGPLALPDLVGCLAASQVFVLPCRDDRRGLQTEGLGLVTLEASAVGLPVVVGRSGGSPDSLLDGVTGRLVDARDPAALAGALAGLLRDPRRAREMGAAGRAWVAARWTWQATAETLAGLLRGDG